jgi:endonuclease/exonuclease/phosphatase family metal-dependent hydrolase
VSTLRLLSYNIRSLRDDGDAVARVIRSVDPHVVCIQEAPRFLRWRSTCAALARRSGLVIVGGGRPAAANLLMSSLSVDVHRVQDVLLSKARKLHQRGVAMAELSLSGNRFVIAGTHLDLEQPARLRHVDELHGVLGDFAGSVPSIIAGDINDLPGTEVWSRLDAQRPDVWPASGQGTGFTYSATSPVKRIDGVFADRRLRAISASVPASEDTRVATDHCPLFVEIEL